MKKQEQVFEFLTELKGLFDKHEMFLTRVHKDYRGYVVYSDFCLGIHVKDYTSETEIIQMGTDTLTSEMIDMCLRVKFK